MSVRRTLSLGPIRVEVELEGEALAERYDWRYAGLAAPGDFPGAIAARITLRSKAGPEALDMAWQPTLTSRRDGSCLSVDWPGAAGSFDLASREGAFEVRTDAKGFGMAVDDVFRVVGFELALAADVLLFHAAALGPATAEWVDLFAGRSGVGKTTLTERLVSAGETAISDDLVFVTLAPGPIALPTPFKGTTRAPRTRPAPCRLRSFLLLRQATQSGCRWLSGPEKLVRVLRSTVTYRDLTTLESSRIAEIAAALAEACPVGELSLTLADDPRVVLAANPDSRGT